MNTLAVISDQSEIKNYPAVLILCALALLGVWVWDRRAAARRRKIYNPELEACKRRHPSYRGVK